MATIKFLIKNSKSDYSTIYVRFRHGRQIDLKRTTSLLVDGKYWNNSKGEVRLKAEFKDKVNLQKKLNSLKGFIQDEFNQDFSTGKIIDGNWLETKIAKNLNREESIESNSLLGYIDAYITSAPTRINSKGELGLAKNSVKKYKNLKSTIKSFERHSKKSYLLSEVDLKFYDAFVDFLKTEQAYNSNTIGSHISALKAVLKDALANGYAISSNIHSKAFKAPKEKVPFATLSIDEIHKIFDLDLASTPHLDNARDWMILNCWIGLRIEDLMSLTSENIEIRNGHTHLVNTSGKTDTQVNLIAHPQVQAILDKNNGFPRPISEQKFNKYIKKICLKAELTALTLGSLSKKQQNGKWRKVIDYYPKHDLIASHTLRRSFATNHYDKLPNKVIMAATGHSSEKEFLGYINKPSLDHNKDFAELWGIEKQA